jgi:rubrerythrin
VTPDVKGVVIGALTPPRPRLSVEEVLEAVRGNEQLTNSVYAKVVAKGLPKGVRELVERAQAEERHHLDWVQRALSRRLWDRPAVAQP